MDEVNIMKDLESVKIESFQDFQKTATLIVKLLRFSEEYINKSIDTVFCVHNFTKYSIGKKEKEADKILKIINDLKSVKLINSGCIVETMKLFTNPSMHKVYGVYRDVNHQNKIMKMSMDVIQPLEKSDVVTDSLRIFGKAYINNDTILSGLTKIVKFFNDTFTINRNTNVDFTLQTSDNKIKILEEEVKKKESELFTLQTETCSLKCSILDLKRENANLKLINKELHNEIDFIEYELKKQVFKPCDDNDFSFFDD